MKNKKFRFQVVAGRANVLEPGKELFEKIRGKWNEDFFHNTNPVTLELACGRGEYSVALASRFPQRDFIGVDIKGDRIWKGSTLAVEQKLLNVGFLRTNILNLEAFFTPGEVDEIWITFPDPRPKKRDVKRRLTSSRFLDAYKSVLKPGGVVRLKTDSDGLFAYTLEELNSRSDVKELAHTFDVYDSPYRPECFDIKTRYEEMFAADGEKIKYLRFSYTESSKE